MRPGPKEVRREAAEDREGKTEAKIACASIPVGLANHYENQVILFLSVPGVIDLRGLLLHITLKFEPKYCPKELQLLASKLPPETRRVWHGSGEDPKTMCFLVPQMDLPEIWAAKLRSTLAAFDDWTLTQVGPLSASKYGSACPFETWMDNNVRVGEIRKPSKSKNVPLSQRWKIGR